MHSDLHLLTPLAIGLLSLLACTFPECVVSKQIFQTSLAGHNYCPSPLDAFQGLTRKSRIQCAAECKLSEHCIEFSYYDSSGKCYLYSFLPATASFNSECNFMMDWYAYVKNNCTAMELARGSCRGAFDEYYGCLTITMTTIDNDTLMVCQALPGVAMQLELASLNLSGRPISLPIINGWIIMMQRFDGSLGFNRGWIDYRNGFGDVGRGEAWLGNEKVHLVTTQPGQTYQLHVEIQLYTSGDWYYADYANFSIDSESGYYALHVSGYSGNAMDAFCGTSLYTQYLANGMNFSTPDSDNDQNVDSSCAANYGCGWWFNSCWWACLTCDYFSNAGNNYMSWYTLEKVEPYGRARAARMMIRSN